MTKGPVNATRPRPRLFQALGAQKVPAAIEVDGGRFALSELLKHDSWAATAIYSGGGRKIVCKFNRQQGIFGFPMRWVGLRLARRETRLMTIMADSTNIPRLCGAVHADGVMLPHAVAHEYVEGHPLKWGEPVNDDFFPQLRRLLDEMHRRGIAYVDLHKAENIIVGDDGRPYLIDFQISSVPAAGFWGKLSPWRILLPLLKRGDDYHLLKHRIRTRPDQLPPGQRGIVRQRPWFIWVHRILIGIPFRFLRRRLLVALSIRSGSGSASSEAFAEDAVRRENPPPGNP